MGTSVDDGTAFVFSQGQTQSPAMEWKAMRDLRPGKNVAMGVCEWRMVLTEDPHLALITGKESKILHAVTIPLLLLASVDLCGNSFL